MTRKRKDKAKKNVLSTCNKAQLRPTPKQEVSAESIEEDHSVVITTVKRRSMLTGALLRFIRRVKQAEQTVDHDLTRGDQVDDVIQNLRQYVQKNREQFYGLWDYLIIILSLVSVGMILTQILGVVDQEVLKLFRVFDHIICAIFFIDFSFRLYTAVSKRSYLKWGWIDLVSSIPMLEELRWGRVLRLLRIVRAVKGAMRGHQKIERRIQDPFISVLIVSFLSIFLGAVSVLYLESGVEGANIRSARDAIWWAFVTVTTVGYGDFTPITNEGRLIAVFLMSTGIGIFGIFSVQCTQYFVRSREEHKNSELSMIKEELNDLRQEVSELTMLLKVYVEHQEDKLNEEKERLNSLSEETKTE